MEQKYQDLIDIGEELLREAVKVQTGANAHSIGLFSSGVKSSIRKFKGQEPKMRFDGLIMDGNKVIGFKPQVPESDEEIYQWMLIQTDRLRKLLLSNK